MISTISNGEIEISAKTSGAELTSVKKISNGLEYLWQGDKEVWGRNAPVLFPIVGKVKNNTYQVDGREYSLPQHGFARDKDFELIEKTETLLSYSLKYSEETLDVYPFKFELLIQYELDKYALTTRYIIKNLDNKEIYFSIGAHPGFICPILPDENYSDYYLEFEKEEIQSMALLDNGLRNGKFKPVLNNEKIIPLSYELFKDDALIFKNLNSRIISLKSKRSGHGFHFSIQGFPYVGIWSKPGPFVCIEPWLGVADSIDSTGDFKNKEGIIKLPQDKSFDCEFSVVVF